MTRLLCRDSTPKSALDTVILMDLLKPLQLIADRRRGTERLRQRTRVNVGPLVACKRLLHRVTYGIAHALRVLECALNGAKHQLELFALLVQDALAETRKRSKHAEIGAEVGAVFDLIDEVDHGCYKTRALLARCTVLVDGTFDGGPNFAQILVQKRELD